MKGVFLFALLIAGAWVGLFSLLVVIDWLQGPSALVSQGLYLEAFWGTAASALALALGAAGVFFFLGLLYFIL